MLASSSEVCSLTAEAGAGAAASAEGGAGADARPSPTHGRTLLSVSKHTRPNQVLTQDLIQDT